MQMKNFKPSKLPLISFVFTVIVTFVCGIWAVYLHFYPIQTNLQQATPSVAGPIGGSVFQGNGNTSSTNTTNIYNDNPITPSAKNPYNKPILPPPERTPHVENRPVADNSVQRTLDNTVQNVGDLKVTLIRLEGGTGSISIYFTVENTSAQEIEQQVFATSWKLTRNSNILMNGRKYTPSSIEFSGKSNKSSVIEKLVPGHSYNGKLDFDGLHGSVNDIEYVEIGFGQRTASPKDFARFNLPRL